MNAVLLITLLLITACGHQDPAIEIKQPVPRSFAHQCAVELTPPCVDFEAACEVFYDQECVNYYQARYGVMPFDL